MGDESKQDENKDRSRRFTWEPDDFEVVEDENEESEEEDSDKE